MKGLCMAALAFLAFGTAGSSSAFADAPRGPVRARPHAGPPVVVHRPPAVVHRHGGAARFGLFVGAPLVLSSGYWGPHYYHPSPYYSPYYPPVITVPVSPPTYVEQGQVNAPIATIAPEASAAPAAPQPGYWYYCGSSQTYYPYVKECPGGWQRVAPQPPPG